MPLSRLLRAALISRSDDTRIIDLLRGRRGGVGERLIVANTRIKHLISRINSQLSILEEREKILFDKLVYAIENKDNVRANIIASEISQIRNIKKHLLAFSLVLENISLRIDNILLLGSISKDLPVILGVVRETRSIMKSMFPNMEIEFMSIEDVLRGLVDELRDQAVIGAEEYSPTVSTEAKKILEEAYLVAEERIRSSLPRPEKADTEVRGERVDKRV